MIYDKMIPLERLVSIGSGVNKSQKHPCSKNHEENDPIQTRTKLLVHTVKKSCSI